MNHSDFPRTVRDLLNHPDWDGWISDRLGNDLFLSDPDRARRIHEAAEHGADGSTHGEHIDDWREFAAMIHDEERSKLWRVDDEEFRGYDRVQAEDALDDAYAILMDAIDECEKRHEQAGTLHSQVG